METDLVRSVLRALRYRPVDHLLGRVVEFHSLDHVEEAVRLAVGPEDFGLIASEPLFREGIVAKYGTFDLRFRLSGERLADEPPVGLALLRELGFLPGGHAGSGSRVCNDPICLEMLQQELDERTSWLLLLLMAERPGDDFEAVPIEASVSLRLPEGYLPRRFRIEDACLTNAASVWMWKHFYV